MNKQLGIVFLTALTLACSGQAQESADSATTSGPPSVISWIVDVSVDCDATGTKPEPCLQSGDHVIMVDENGPGSHPDRLILIREEDNLHYGYHANVVTHGSPGPNQRIVMEFLDHVGCPQDPVKKRFTVSNLPGGAGNENDLKACLGRFETEDPDGKIGYKERVHSCMKVDSVHWSIETIGPLNCPTIAGPPDDGQGTGTGGN